MASTLFDTIQQNLNSQSGQQAPMQDQTLRSKKLFQAKSGKSVSDGSEAPISSIGEQAANAETTSGLAQVGQQAQLQGQQLQAGQDALTQKTQEQQGLLESRKRADTVENNIKTNQLLQSLEQGKGKLDVDQDRATKQQIAFGLRMQNQEYVDNLQRAAASARLDNEAAFQEELLKQELGDREDILRNKLGDASFLDDSDRDFKKKLTQMDADTSYQTFRDNATSAKERAFWTSLGSLAGAGAGAYSSSSSKSRSTEGQ